MIFVIYVQNYWGKGEKLSQAIENLEDAQRGSMKRGRDYVLQIWDGDYKAFNVDDFGGVNYKTGTRKIHEEVGVW